MREYRRLHPNAQKTFNSAWYQKNKEHVKKKTREWSLANPEKRSAGNNKSRWKGEGIINKDGSAFTQIDYDRLYQIQQGSCAICKMHSTELDKALAADHDHQTGIVRGLLCFICNSKLGHKEASDWHTKADNYLEDSSNVP